MAQSSSGGGVSIFTILGVVFITLKLCGIINWSWWWVTAPLWGGFLFVFVVVFLIGLLTASARSRW